MRNILLALAAVAVTAATPALAKKAPPPPPPAPAQSLTCKDGTISTGKARQQACRGHGGVFAAVATKTVATAPGSVSATTVATKLPEANVGAKTVATTVNNGPSTAKTEITQISTPGAPDTHMKTVPGDITVRCHDGKVMKVSTIRKACKTHGGLVSSVTTAVMVVPAGETKSIATKTGAGVAVATTKNPENAASATRVTQTTVYQQPVTAICHDGSTTSTTSRKDACKTNGGVKVWK